MLFDKSSLESFNLAGSVCSIIALLLTASSKLGMANFTQIVFGVLVGICFGGLVMNRFIAFYRREMEWSYFFTKAIFWLFSCVIVGLVALLTGKMGYWLMDKMVEFLVIPVLKA